MKKGIYLAIAICAISILAVGCGSKPTSSGPVQGSDPANTTPAPIVNQGEVDEESQEIGVFYADDQLLELEQRKKEISFEGESERYSKTYEALQSSDQTELIPLWKNIDLLSATFDQGKLTLDVHIPDEARLGSGGEILAIDALKETFFQFEEISSIDLLVDGEATESLMGHAELEHPLTRE
ncbi:Sporulation and spore germination [Paenibacillus sp. OK060]|uniref:GerMN domain-containing protein n=1 Tax=Paenibacillus sp. OK060 TaxID=1881034 RepID=UPI00088F29F4|nr:GerMN domain-containing protein [Paenibacillus sp. OK060]SDM34128.1 Sporulation and spore germination [Paenibacillus sp. OK060]